MLAVFIMVLPLAVGFDCFMPTAKATDIDFKCGENATWSLDTQAGVLKIEGTGETYYYSSYSAPWYTYAKYINKVIVCEGITCLNRGAFIGLYNLKEISLPASLETLIAYDNFYSLETIDIAENSNLTCVRPNNFASQSVWYKNLPDCSAVRIGCVVLGFKGTPSENTSVTIPDGTKAINENAFKGLSDITDFIFPGTVETVGASAFEGTGWLDSLPYGAVYVDKALYLYKEIMPISEADFVVKDGTVSISDYAFRDNEVIGSISFPETLEIIGNRAFAYCKNLKRVSFAENGSLKVLKEWSFYDTAISEIVFPDTLETMEGYTFGGVPLKYVYIPESIKKLDGAFNMCSKVEQYEVSPDNAFYCSDENGVLFSKDKTVLYYVPSYIDMLEYTVPEGVTCVGEYAFSYSQLKKITLNDDLESIGTNAFYRSYADVVDLGNGLPQLNKSANYNNWGLDYLTIPENIKTVEESALGYHLDYVYFASKDVVIERDYTLNSQVKFICYEDSTVFEYAKKYDVNYVLLDDDNIGDYTEYNYALRNFQALSLSRKSSYSYWHISAIVENIPLNISKAYQYEIDAFVSEINECFEDMRIEWSDFSAVDEAIAKANAINRALYSAESLSRLDLAVASVERNCDVADSLLIKEYVDNIENAIEKLEEKPGDFSALIEIAETAKNIERSLYTPESLLKLDEAVNKVDFNKENITQNQIDEWSRAIEKALGELEYKAADYSSVNELKKQAEGIDRSLYTPESLAKLDEALEAVDYNLKADNQAKVSEWSRAIEKALGELEYKAADYSSVNELKKQAEGIDRSLYTPESLAKLDEALEAVDYNLKADNQAKVSEWSRAIEKALGELEYKPADYSAVESEIRKAEKLDMRYYSEVSKIVLNNAINAVDYTLDITHQPTVDAYAKAIADAIANLDYASIVLRHDLCGIVVSATTKEIKPDTVLAVEEVDSSEYEGTNFAVGGSIRSLHFYDIKLVLQNKTVQPDGTVTVKIKLANGVDPAKCKVYHVTDDVVNPLVRYSSTIDGNYIVFETDHFSEFAVIEVETVVDRIEISHMPQKTVYGIGETFDASGLAVTAYFSDGTSRLIDDYDVGTVNLLSTGKKSIAVYYTFGSVTKSVSFEITVVADNVTAEIFSEGKSSENVSYKAGLFSLYSKASILLECRAVNADGLTVRWSSDNSKVMVDSNGKVTCKGLFGAKKACVTLEIFDGSGNVVATDKVTVVFYKLSFQLSKLMPQAEETRKHLFL